MRMNSLLIPVLCALSFAACRQKEAFPDIGQKFAGPSATAVTDDGRHFFVLNSDFERAYDSGSLMVIDESGKKAKVLRMPRMGRALVVAGNDLFLGFDRENEKGEPELRLYDITNPEEPVLKKSWKGDCTPLNVAARANYGTFAVSCANGALWVGELAADRAQSTFKKVRDYGNTRRAMYLDPARELLFMFPTDYARPNTVDLKAEPDAETYDQNTGDLIPGAGPNDVPDAWENSKKALRQNQDRRQTYQYVVYDVKAERAAGFPLRVIDDATDKTVERELRWLYFSLANFDGTPDNDVDPASTSQKTYRTNVWHAEADPVDPDSFYISQRGGMKDSEFANNVVHVTLTGDPRVSADGKVPLTSDVMSFTRVYGFRGEVDSTTYPGGFTVKVVKGQPLLIVNNFRDLVYWKSDNRAFGLVGKVIGQDYWRAELKTGDYRVSYFEVAMNQRGVGISPAYYGAGATMFTLTPGVGFENVKRIN